MLLLRKASRFGTLLCLLCGGVSAASGPPPASHSHAPPPPPTAAHLYHLMLSANTRFSYRGREAITYWNSGRTEAVTVSHLAPRWRRIDVLSPVRHEGAVFLTNGHEEWQYDPHRREVVHSQLAPKPATNPLSNYLLLKAHYQVSVDAAPQVIDGRKTYVLTIISDKTGRVAKRLWIDGVTGLPLKEEGYNAVKDGKRDRDQLAVTEAFTGINFHPRLTLSMFDPTLLTRRSAQVTTDPVAETPVRLADAPRVLGRAWLVPARLGGFHLVGAGMMPGPRLHLRYSDGLNQVSLFEQRRRQARLPTIVPHARPLRIGTLRAQIVVKSAFTVITWDTPVFILSVVGEVPVPTRTLEQLAQAMNGRKP